MANSAPAIVVGIAGGSGSGKTTLVRRLMETLSPDHVALVEEDAYYRDLPHLTLEERACRNYDHPDALEEELLVEHVRALARGEAVAMPQYDFALHARKAITRRLEPRPCLVVEGILVLASVALRPMLDLRLFVDTDSDIRFIRRMRRDLAERGRSVEGVMEQWEATVRPMHLEFVEPSKRHAHLIIPEGGLNDPALDVLLGHLRRRVGLAD